MSDILLAFF